MKVAIILVALLGLSQGSPVKEVKEVKEVKDSIQCTLCTTVMTALDSILVDPSNEQAVADALLAVCALIPSIQAECEAMISEYLDDIIELIVNQYLQPAQICEAIGLCP